MAQGTRIGSAVMFVQQLDRSVGFYQEVLALNVADQSPTAALLASPDGTQLILRAMGSGAGHPLGGIGVQYVIWTAAGQDDLDRCEQALRRHSAHRSTRRHGAVTVLEGRDPDDVVLMVAYPGPDQVPVRELPTRIYGW
jgi:catechol 2,3-dioxygenase-like lactoylglutathione lyase family enzyme